jgi:hypothetical protein
MGSSRRFALIGLTSLLVSCGSPPAPPPATPPAPHAAPSQPEASAIDTSPVPAPKSLLAVLRVKDGDAAIRSARAMLGAVIPEGITVQAIARAVLGPSLSDVVDVAKPIDFGVAGDMRSPTVLFSLALTSLDDAKQNLVEDFTLTPEKGGVIRLAPKGDPDPRVRCELRPAAGESPYRLVCSFAPEEPGEAAAYFARTVPRQGMSADARLEFFTRYWLHDQIASTSADNPGEEFGKKLFMDLGDDIDVVALDLSFSTAGVDLTTQATFRGTASPLTRIIASQAQQATPMPDSFWRLPADSEGAIYTRGANPADLQTLRSWMDDTFSQSMTDDGAPPELVERMVKVLNSVILTGGPMVMAYGFDVKEALAALKRATPKAKMDRRALHGWLLLGVDEPSARWTDAIREAIAIDKVPYTHKSKSTGPSRDDKTDTKPGDKSEKKKTISRLAEERVADKALPAGTSHFVSREYPAVNDKANTKKPPVSATHMYVVPGGAQTWIAFGENEAQVLAKVKGVIANQAANQDKGLSGRDDLQLLHAPVGLGGFVTVPLFDALGLPESADDDQAKAREALERMASLPPKGASAVPFFVPPADASGGRAVQLRVRLPKAVVQEIARRIKAH